MIDPIWEERYSAGVQQRYPWSQVVSFVMRYRSRDKPREQTRILEIGCGTGGNLWFAAREGFVVTGRDGSESAIATATKRFTEEGLSGDFSVATFDRMILPSGHFDLVIDRGALTCVSYSTIKDTVSRVHDALAPGGAFLFTPFATQHHVRATASKIEDKLATGLKPEAERNYGALSFLTEDDVRAVFSNGWSLVELQRIDHHDLLNQHDFIVSEWQAVARKV